MPTGEADETLSDTAFDVVRRYRSFTSYGSEAKAVKALRRRCPNYSDEECKTAFRQSLCLFETAAQILAKHKDYLLAAWQSQENANAGMKIDEEVHHSCPEFSVVTCRAAWSWIFYWEYLR